MKGKQLNFDGVQDIRKQPTSVRGDFDVFKELTFDDVCHAWKPLLMPYSSSNSRNPKQF